LNAPIGSGIVKDGLEHQVGIRIKYDGAGRSLLYRLNPDWSADLKDKIKRAIEKSILRHPSIIPNPPVED
ncbi:MAG TPA: hypothetical protein VFC34_14910, partial [Puia sp.]|nr:hypothetical protein [Puia sp.]